MAQTVVKFLSVEISKNPVFTGEKFKIVVDLLPALYYNTMSLTNGTVLTERETYKIEVDE